MSNRLFGTDGIRGVANEELTSELALRLGLAAGHLLRGRRPGTEPKVVVGVDSRISSPMLEAALSSGLCAMGVDVISPGLMPTPAVARITCDIGADAGVVISASHNVYSDNGIKFFGSTGYKLDDALERALEDLALRAFDLPRPTGNGIGHIRRDPGLRSLYAAHIEATMSGVRLDGLKIVVDAANGAASELGPRILRDLGAEVIAVNCSPDGLNINDNCGALHPRGMAERVLAEHADAGVAFDGDADRAILADRNGNLVDGDRVMAICGLALSAREQLAGLTVVGTIMSNMGLEVALGKHGIKLERTAVGDRNVSERMREGGFVIGGEKSGHIVFGALTTTGDGILTALQVLKAEVESGRPLDELASVMSEFPQVLLNIRVTDRNGWQSDSAVMSAIQIAESRLAGYGRINVRASGTEQLIRVMVEAPDPAVVDSTADSVASVIRANWGASA
jgi:phosphoglucosamine mutase